MHTEPRCCRRQDYFRRCGCRGDGPPFVLAGVDRRERATGKCPIQDLHAHCMMCMYTNVSPSLGLAGSLCLSNMICVMFCTYVLDSVRVAYMPQILS